jgi:predicted transcriptional regulator
MNLQQIISKLGLKVLTQPKDFSKITLNAGYSADLLSCVMASGAHGGIWVTLQAHMNIVAVAALLELSAVIITEDAQPDEATLKKADQEGITLLSTTHTTFYIVGKLWEMGIREK